MRSLNSSNKYLLSTHYVPGTVLGAGDTTKNETDKNPYLHEADILVRETINEYIKYVVCQTVISVKGKNRAGGRQGEYVWIWERVIVLHRVMVIKGRTFQTEGITQAKALGQQCA